MKQPYIVGALLVLYRYPNPVYDGVKAIKYLNISAFFPINYESVCCGQTALSFLHADITGTTLNA